MKLAHALHQPPGDGPFPTLFAFHGYGSNALDLLGLAPHVARGRLLVIAPQGPDELVLDTVGAGAPRGFGWFPLTLASPPTPLAVASAVARAREFVDEAIARYPVDARRVGMLGFSQGGVIAYALALSAPDRFRVLAALSSWLPDDLAKSLPAVDRSGLAALVQHGRQDEVIAPSRGRSSAEKLRAFGAEVSFREYDMAHEVGARSLADLSAWLEERLL
jgi:phospholipase/carboxylesterase